MTCLSISYLLLSSFLAFFYFCLLSFHLYCLTPKCGSADAWIGLIMDRSAYG